MDSFELMIQNTTSQESFHFYLKVELFKKNDHIYVYYDESLLTFGFYSKRLITIESVKCMRSLRHISQANANSFEGI